MESASQFGGLTPMRLLGDEALARLTSRGSDSAFAVIYERHQAALYRYCRGLLLDDEDARDAVQATMLNAMRALRRHDRDLAVRAWLYRIAHNEAVSMIRRRRPHDLLDEQTPVTLPSAASDADTRARLAVLVNDLKELPERQRQALLMRELVGLSYTEVAGALGVSGAAAKQTVFEARSSLAEVEAGRQESCGTVRERIADGDRRVLRGRRVRAHLHDCGSCRDFETALSSRRRDLALLVPMLSGSTGAGLIASVLRGATQGDGLVATLLAGSGGSGAAIGATLTKGAAVAAIAAGAAAGIAGQSTHPVTPGVAHRAAIASTGHASRDAGAGPRVGAVARARTRSARAAGRRTSTAFGARADGLPARLGRSPASARTPVHRPTVVVHQRGPNQHTNRPVGDAPAGDSSPVTAPSPSATAPVATQQAASYQAPALPNPQQIVNQVQHNVGTMMVGMQTQVTTQVQTAMAGAGQLINLFLPHPRASAPTTTPQ